MTTDLTTIQLAEYIAHTVGDNFPALLVIIAVGAGVKIVLDILFSALYNITSSK